MFKATINQSINQPIHMQCPTTLVEYSQRCFGADFEISAAVQSVPPTMQLFRVRIAFLI